MDQAQRIDLSRLLELARWLDPQISTDAEHSTRVSRVAIELADAAGLDGRAVAQTTLAGLLHDVGKIIVPRAVLLKPGGSSRASTTRSSGIRARAPSSPSAPS